MLAEIGAIGKTPVCRMGCEAGRLRTPIVSEPGLADEFRV